MAFFQDPPRLGNQYHDDALLWSYLRRTLPGDLLAAIEGELVELGDLSGGRFFEMQLAEIDLEPRLVPFDPWGRRVDRIEVTPLWREAQRLSAERGLVAVAYERRDAQYSRVHQFVLNYVIQASLDIYSCPLAMTDGAARTLIDLQAGALVERAVPRLTSRDPSRMWTSGQWMTERTGGSDVGISETVARRDPADPEGTFRLHGSKWFTSATTAEMALTLARPEGNGPGGRGLALFYVETRDPQGLPNGMVVNRLKDKLGTRKVPTAELELVGARATPVAGLDGGVRNITSMLNITRTWNAVAAAWSMRRAVALARDYAGRRVQFGARLADKPLHVDTLEGMEAEAAAGFLLAFRAVELLGRREAGVADERDQQLLRIVTPIAKLTTGKQAAAVASEAIESFGGAGYVEDTGLPLLLRDAQVLPIWEGTTNVLSLDVLRALGKLGSLAPLQEEIAGLVAATTAPSLRPAVETVERALAHAAAWVAGALEDPARLEAGARRFALTLGRCHALALLAAHASFCLEHQQADQAARLALRFARHAIDSIHPARG